MTLNYKQKHLLELLIRVNKLAEENGIKYFLFGGSTIGALRHNGFIPWDDDIDIIIDAENFYKLFKLFENGPVDDINLVYFHNDPYWYRAYAMLTDTKDTCYTRPCMYTKGLNGGTRIDTMIMDRVPTERLEEYKHDLMLYQEILTDSTTVDQAIYKIKDEYYALRERQDEIGKTVLERELRTKLESYSTPDADQLVVRYSTRAMRHYDIDTLYEPLYHDFEGYMMPVPGKPQKQLRQQFGYDWYVIPAQEEHKVHMFFSNPDICSRNYHEDVTRFYDRDTLEAAARKRKSIQIERRPVMNENMDFRCNMQAQKGLMRTDMKTKAGLYEEMAAEGRWEELFNALRPLTAEVRSFASVAPEHWNIPEKVIKGWLRACIVCGRYYAANRINKSFGLDEIPEYKEECEFLSRVLRLAEAYQDGNKALMKEALETFTDDEKKIIPECVLAYCAVNRSDDGHFENKEALLEAIEKYTETVSKNYDVMKAKADILYDSGETDKAMDLYKKVHKSTRNGLDLLDIETRFGLGPRFTGSADEDEIDCVIRDILNR